MKKTIQCLALLLAIVTMIVGCGSRGKKNGRSQDGGNSTIVTDTKQNENVEENNEDISKTEDIEQIDDKAEIVDSSEVAEVEEKIESEVQTADVGFNGYAFTSQFAILKDTLEVYDFMESGIMDHWMRLTNNSSESIHITGARVIVHDYKPLEPDSYVLYRAGDGDKFDPYVGFYSQVEGNAQTYDAYLVELDDRGKMIDDSINWDPVMRVDIDAATTQPIKFYVDFNDPGVYSYELVIDYEYNGRMEYASSGIRGVLYDNDRDAMERALDEFHENEEYYMQSLY